MVSGDLCAVCWDRPADGGDDHLCSVCRAERNRVVAGAGATEKPEPSSY